MGVNTARLNVQVVKYFLQEGFLYSKGDLALAHNLLIVHVGTCPPGEPGRVASAVHWIPRAASWTLIMHHHLHQLSRALMLMRECCGTGINVLKLAEHAYAHSVHLMRSFRTRDMYVYKVCLSDTLHSHVG